MEIWAEDEEAPPNIRYTVTVYTSDIRNAGTDANVSCVLYGDKRNSPLMKLDNRFEAWVGRSGLLSRRGNWTMDLKHGLGGLGDCPSDKAGYMRGCSSKLWPLLVWKWKGMKNHTAGSVRNDCSAKHFCQKLGCVTVYLRHADHCFRPLSSWPLPSDRLLFLAACIHTACAAKTTLSVP